MTNSLKLVWGFALLGSAILTAANPSAANEMSIRRSELNVT